jgi:hypothetical protein
MYVGKGKGKRFRSHLAHAANPILKRKIERIRIAGLEPEVRLLNQELSCEEACQAEKEIIARWGRLDLRTGLLCNLTDGGEGTEGRVASPKTRQLFSQQRAGKKQTPAQYAANCNRAPQTEEARQKRSLANKGHRRHTSEQMAAITRSNQTRVISDETRQLWSSQRRGIKQTPEHIQKVLASKQRALVALREAMTEDEWAARQRARYSSRIGKSHSAETKAKMRAAWLRRKGVV